MLQVIPENYFLKPGLGSVINPFHPLSRGLVGCWLMNEQGGKQAIDLVYKNNGSITSVKGYISGNKGTGIRITAGTSDVINCGNAVQLSNLTKMTIMQFGYYYTLPGAIGTPWRIVCKDNSGSGQFWMMAFNNNDVNCLSFQQSFSVTTLKVDTSPNSLTAPNLYNLCVTVNGSLLTSGVNFYINGINYSGRSSNNQSNGSGTYSDTTIPFCIGNRGNQATTRSIDALIYVTFIWNRILSPSETQSLYINPYQFIYPRIVPRFKGAGAPASSISKVAGVTRASIGKVGGVSLANIKKVAGVTN